MMMPMKLHKCVPETYIDLGDIGEHLVEIHYWVDSDVHISGETRRTLHIVKAFALIHMAGMDMQRVDITPKIQLSDRWNYLAAREFKAMTEKAESA